MAIPIAVARIIAITQGRTPERKALTPAYFIRFLSTAAIKSIIMKDGRTTPSTKSTLFSLPHRLSFTDNKKYSDTENNQAAGQHL